MSAVRRLSVLSVDEYLAGERQSALKHEYAQGAAHAMAGASLAHNRIVRNLSGLLWNVLRGGPCEPLTSDMLLKTSAYHFRYPDLMVVCADDPSTDPYVREAPRLIIEVLSPHTRRQDKTAKRAEYLALPSLQEYMLVETEHVEIEVQRRSQAWHSSYYFLGEELTLESVPVTLPVEQIYERVENGELAAWRQQQAAAACEGGEKSG